MGWTKEAIGSQRGQLSTLSPEVFFTRPGWTGGRACGEVGGGCLLEEET